MRKYLVLSHFSILSAICLSAAASPSPAIIKAELTDNDTITITGSSLGTNNPMLFWDDVNNIDNQKLKTVVPSSNGSLWKENTNQWGSPMVYESTRLNDPVKNRDGFYFGDGHKSFVGSPTYTNQPSTESNNKIYVSWWYKPGKSPSDEGGSNKFIRIWDDTNGLGTRISWTQMHLTCINNQEPETVTWTTWNGQIGKWNHHEIFVDLTKNKIQTWVNGVLTATGECKKDTSKLNVPLYVGLIGFDHGSSAYNEMTTAIDDIYIGSNAMRVVISNEPTWSSSSKNTVLPVVSWSENEIILKQAFGKVHNQINKSYFYLIDANGEIINNNGVPLDTNSSRYFPAPSQ